MARQRNPNRDEAKKRWLESGGTITTKELSQFAEVPESRIRKWKSEDGWTEELNKKKRGGQRGNKNAAGFGAPLRNDNAVTHGAYTTIHLDELPPEQRAYIESITLDTKDNMLRELQLLMAKEDDLKRKIRTLETADSSALYIDRVVEMRVPKSNERYKNNAEKLEELQIERDNFVWEINSKQAPSPAEEKKLDKYEREIEALQDKVNAYERANDGKDFNVSMQTYIKASSFERVLKLEAELNKIHGRIIKLLDSIKSYELEARRIELEEKKYRFAKQRITGEFDVDPDTGEINDEFEEETEEKTQKPPRKTEKR